MKTLWYKYLCLLLMIICYMPGYADQRASKGLIHILRIGLAGGGTYNLTPADCTMKSGVGGTGAIALDYAFYKSLRSIDLGLRTGLDLGYQYSPYQAAFSHQFSQQDYLGNQMDYTTSGEVKIAQHQLLASIPLMFALRSGGFVWNIGVRMQSAVYQTGQQQLSNPTITAYYPAYDVAITNELITGLVADEQLSSKIDIPAISIECLAATEIGYEYAINRSHAIGVMAYFYAGLWGTRAKASNTPVISVAPITDGSNPVPTVTVHDAYHSLLSAYTPLQFGVKVYYAFHL